METEQFDYADDRRWTLMQLHLVARELSFTKETTPIPRQRDEADRKLGYVAFEMWARRHHDRGEEAVYGEELSEQSN